MIKCCMVYMTKGGLNIVEKTINFRVIDIYYNFVGLVDIEGIDVGEISA